LSRRPDVNAPRQTIGGRNKPGHDTATWVNMPDVYQSRPRAADQISVIEAAIEHSAGERKGKHVMFGDESRNRLRATRCV
jgi:hypothetical protein